jgi:RNA polymerase sigma factor (sigma-70 family)
MFEAREGRREAWDELVARLSPRVWAVARAHRLDHADAADVAQLTWMRLAEHLHRIERPEAVGAWVATTARREALRILRQQASLVPTDAEDLEDRVTSEGADVRVLQHERDRLLWSAFLELSERCQALLRVTVAAKDAGYDEIGAALGMPIGSIGPTRQRCLDRLRTLVADRGIERAADASL